MGSDGIRQQLPDEYGSFLDVHAAFVAQMDAYCHVGSIMQVWCPSICLALCLLTASHILFFKNNAAYPRGVVCSCCGEAHAEKWTLL
jgi:hypothetical protein